MVSRTWVHRFIHGTHGISLVLPETKPGPSPEAARVPCEPLPTFLALHWASRSWLPQGSAKHGKTIHHLGDETYRKTYQHLNTTNTSPPSTVGCALILVVSSTATHPLHVEMPQAGQRVLGPFVGDAGESVLHLQPCCIDLEAGYGFRTEGPRGLQIWDVWTILRVPHRIMRKNNIWNNVGVEHLDRIEV